MKCLTRESSKKRSANWISAHSGPTCEEMLVAIPMKAS